MSKLRKRVLKVFVYITYPLLIFALVVCGTLLFLENRKYNQLNDSFNNARESLNKANEDKQITIDDLSEEFQEQTDLIASLKSENAQLKSQIGQLEDDARGIIAGRIFPFITADNNTFIQYQLVCAESATNKNLIYCSSVSTINQTYSLSVPVGNYKVYAQLFPLPASDSPYASKKAYYTEYIACVQAQDESSCDEKKNAPVTVEVKAGQLVSGVDPISWQ